MENELLRLAWKDTEVKDPKKIFSSLGVGVLFIISTWFAGLRTWQQALVFVACSIAAYLLAVGVEFIYHYIRHWIIRRKQTLIATVDDLASHCSKIEQSLGAAQGKFVEFKDVCNEVEQSWRDWEKNKTDPQSKWLEKNFPDTVITTKEIEPVRQQLMREAAKLAEEMKSIQELLNFRLGPLV